SVSSKVGIEVVIPDNIRGSCCGQIFSSKGFSDAYRHTANEIVDRLWPVTLEGELPVVIDVSSCAYTLRQIRPALSDENKKRFDRLRILDSVEYLHDLVISRAVNVIRKDKIVL